MNLKIFTRMMLLPASFAFRLSLHHVAPIQRYIFQTRRLMQKHESDLGIRKEHLQHVGETKNNETIGNNGVSTVVDSNTLRAAAAYR